MNSKISAKKCIRPIKLRPIKLENKIIEQKAKEIQLSFPV
jgi:hypothetical protein